LASRARPRRRVWLLRHAKSSWSDPALEDVERPLARRGRRAAKAIARDAAARGAALPALVLCSPARRALETLEPWRKRLPDGARIRIERPLYLASAARLLARLRRLPETQRDVLLIGHDPGLHQLAVALARPSRSAADARLREKLPTGALVELELDLSRWRSLAPGAARLVRFVRPRDLA
jgi:phosphohistidine phosphatase